MKVLLAYEKHGTMVYASALACLNQRVKDDQYDEPERSVAAVISRSLDEERALRFLMVRNGAEYETVEWVTVIE